MRCIMRWVSLVLSVIFMVLMMPEIHAKEPNWLDEGVPVEVLPNADGIYEIYTAEQLAWVSQMSRQGKDMQKAKITLMRDIDLSAREWTPIYDIDAYGLFDGNWHKISGLRMGSEAIPTDESGGLFYWVDGPVKNLTLENIELYTVHGCGGIAGFLKNNGKIINCSVTGKIVAMNALKCDIGLLVESNQGRIENSYSMGSVLSVNANVGGLAGNNKGKIYNCYSLGMWDDGYKSQFLVGNNSGTIEKCYWDKEHNAYPIGDCKDMLDGGMTIADMQSATLVNALNSYYDITYAQWKHDDSNVNSCFPILEHQIPSTLNYWIANAVEVQEKDGVYEIYSPNQFAWISLQVWNGNHFEGKTIKLMHDINLAGKVWMPIGGTEEVYFSGVFDGNYRKIKNAYINTAGTYNFYKCGIFGMIKAVDYVTLPVIKNVGVENVRIESSSATGGLVGTADSFTTIQNCYVTGMIEGDDLWPIGGMCGETDGATFANCYSRVEIKGNVGYDYSLGYNAGGLIGRATYSIINNSYSSGNIFSYAEEIGGLVGESGAEQVSYSFWNNSAFHVISGNQNLPVSAKRAYGNKTTKTGGKTEAELRDANTFAKWDFVDTWAIDSSINDGFPYLKGFAMDTVSATNVALNIASADLTKGESVQLYPIFTPSNTTEQAVTWSSSNTAVATVDAFGRVTAVAGGTVKITATTSAGLRASCDIIVNAFDYTVSNLALTTFHGQTMETIPDEGAFVVNADIKKNSNRDGADYIMFVAYDTNAAMINFSFVRPEMEKGKTMTAGIMMSVPKDRDIESVKVFVWSDIASLRALSNCAEFY